MELHEYAIQDAIGLAELIRAGDVSVAEVEETARLAIETVEPELNALAGPLFDEPLDYAAAGPLAGVPFLIKDLVVHAAGVPTELGSRMLRGFVAQTDTDLMMRFRQAGLATLARTATPEFGFNASTEPVMNGPTRNPWNTARSAGGSSGGSAALVAARAVPFAHANDGGGSIRIPASCCGLVGLKPTRGRTPIGPEVDEGLNGLGIEFALTRTVRDAAALLDAVQGPGIGEKYIIAPPARPYVEEVGAPVGTLRVGVTTEAWSGVPVDRECVSVVEDACRVLESLGHEITPASPTVDAEAFHVANVRIWSAFLAQWIAVLSQVVGIEPGPDCVEATVLACMEHGRSLTALELLEALSICNAVNRSVGSFFQDYDVFVTPTTASPPLPLGYLDANEPSLDADGWTRKIFAYAPFTALFNCTGQPAMSLPLGHSAQGLPIGVQIAARYGDEATVFRLAGQLEEAMPWSNQMPAVAVAQAAVP